MRTHADIITDAKPTELARALGFDDANSVYQWRRNNSIPASHWKALDDAGLTTLDELAAAAARKREGAAA